MNGIRAVVSGQVADFIIQDHEGVWTFTSLTQAALDWVEDHLNLEPWQRLGPRAFGVDHRLARLIWESLQHEGFIIFHA